MGVSAEGLTNRRTFLRACIAGAGMVMVPKALDRFRWKVGAQGLWTMETLTLTQNGDVWGWGPGAHVALLRPSGLANSVGIITRVSPDSITIDWTGNR